MSRRLDEEKMKICKDSDVRKRGAGSIIKTHPLIPSSTHQQSTDVAIRVDHVSKKYCKSLKRSMLYGVKDIGRNVLGMSSHSENLRKNEFWALDDVSFEVKKGETLGIIGPNGAGKTTLLKMLNGIFWPDKGKITVKGRVGALIAVGAGFHPLLTGRENVYVNGAILGMSKKEVDKKFDSIVDFADIGDFLDTPVKFYSSGMFVRLGFAVAVHCEPDILLVDEVLSVGDLKFRIKCYHKMDEVRENAAIIFVSHSLEHIGRICSQTLLLNEGKIMHYGDVAQGLKVYNNLSSIGSYDAANEHFYPIKSFNMMLNKKEINYGDELLITFEITSEKDIEATFRLVFFEYPARIVVGEVHGRGLRLRPFSIKRGKQTFCIKIPGLHLRSGEYTIGHNLLDMRQKILSAGDGHTNIIVNGSGFGETHNQIVAEIMG